MPIVRLVPYSSEWPAAFEPLRTLIATALGDHAVRIDHIGSTSIPGMSAKDVIDIQVGVTCVTPDEDEAWADRAQRLSASEVRTCARKARDMSREHAARVHKKRCLRAAWDASGDFLRLNGLIPGADGASVLKTLDRIADQLGGDEAGAFAPREQRLADALVELTGTHIADDADADRATVVVHVDADDLEGADGPGHIENGPVVHCEVIRRLACDPRVEIVIRDRDTAGLRRSRVSRIVSPHLMRLLRERDGGCVVCHRSAGCHAHHVKHWAHGGATDLENLVLLCRKCHRLVHEGGFRLARDRFGTVRLIRADSRPVMNRPTRLRPEIRERLLGPARAQRVPMRC